MKMFKLAVVYSIALAISYIGVSTVVTTDAFAATKQQVQKVQKAKTAKKPELGAEDKKKKAPKKKKKAKF